MATMVQSPDLMPSSAATRHRHAPLPMSEQVKNESEILGFLWWQTK
jgi:hypothetical protein